MIANIYRQPVERKDYECVFVDGKWQPADDIGEVCTSSAFRHIDAECNTPLQLVGEAGKGTLRLPVTKDGKHIAFLYLQFHSRDVVALRVGDVEIHLADYPSALKKLEKQEPASAPTAPDQDSGKGPNDVA